MSMLKLGLRAMALGGLAVLAMSPAAANARGCNGVWDQLKWGCAYWDNNNGPQFPYYRARVINVPGLNVPAGTLLQVQGANLIDPKTGKIVAQGGGNIVAQGGGNIVAQGGGNIVAQGGGNVVVRQ